MTPTGSGAPRAETAGAPASGTAPTADRVVLFDPSGTSHAGNAIDGLARAARARGLAVTVHSPERPTDPTLAWTPASTDTMLATRRLQRAQRRVVNRALLEDRSAVAFCDLGLDRTLRSRGPRIPARPSSAFVLHQTNALDVLGDDRRLRRRAERARGVLTELGTTGAQIVTHTATVRARAAELVPDAQVHQLGWPVVGADDPCLAPDWRPAPEGVTVLFAGATRRLKGLDTLLRAARQVPGFDRLVVPGRLPPVLRERLDLSDPRIELWERWLDPAEYRRTFATASLVVLPYRRTYLDRGTYSSVLAEAMAHGRPLLVSEPVAPLLPAGYRGAVVADAEQDETLAAGLADALDRLDPLEHAAMTEGREHVRREHTYEGYLAGILRVCGAAPA